MYYPRDSHERLESEYFPKVGLRGGGIRGPWETTLTNIRDGGGFEPGTIRTSHTRKPMSNILHLAGPEKPVTPHRTKINLVAWETSWVFPSQPKHQRPASAVSYDPSTMNRAGKGTIRQYRARSLLTVLVASNVATIESQVRVEQKIKNPKKGKDDPTEPP